MHFLGQKRRQSDDRPPPPELMQRLMIPYLLPGMSSIAILLTYRQNSWASAGRPHIDHAVRYDRCLLCEKDTDVMSHINDPKHWRH
jgi:hypothetical protein